MISDNPKKKVIRYSLRHAEGTAKVREVTPGRKGVEFVNHTGYSEQKPVVRVIKAQEPRIERSRSSYLNHQPVERVLKTTYVEPNNHFKVLRSTQPPQVLGKNGEVLLFVLIVSYL